MVFIKVEKLKRSDDNQTVVKAFAKCPCSSVGLEQLLYTEKVTGSNPVMGTKHDIIPDGYYKGRKIGV